VNKKNIFQQIEIACISWQ